MPTKLLHFLDKGSESHYEKSVFPQMMVFSGASVQGGTSSGG
jgi:hypothetical protein